MKGKRWVWAALAAVVLVAEALAWADSGSAGNPGEGNEEEEKPWQGKLGDGTVIGEKELAEILKLHRLYIKSEGKEGKKADLANADLSGANLYLANLIKADLTETDLSGTDLSSALLGLARMNKAFLFMANLSEANLWETHLSGAKLVGVNLSRAHLNSTDLSRAELSLAKLSGANLYQTNLNQTIFYETELDEAIYEPVANAQPTIETFATCKGLHLLKYNSNPAPLVELREAFKKTGFREQERQVTYALNHTRTQKGMDAGSPEAYLNYFAFELTSGWGMNPGRPLLIMLGFLFPFSVSYWCFMYRSGPDGIWMVWDENRIRQERRPQKELLKFENGVSELYAFYFSLLSAFHIGWRDLNVGSWITRMQPREYTLRATGWVRFVSGLQSLISVYLLALAVLTYFGRPFE